MGLEISVIKTQFMICYRYGIKQVPLDLQVNLGLILPSTSVKYLSICLNSKLRWLNHIKFLRARSSKYINILKWLIGKEWGISPSQAINFVNATVVQFLWESTWFINASNTNFRILENITIGL